MTCATQVGRRLGLVLLLSGTAAIGRAQSPASPATIESAMPAKRREWRVTASATVSESFDSNVFLQDVTPLANHQSLVTSVAPFLGTEWEPGPELLVTANYSPEIVRYMSDSSEDHTDHCGHLNFAGQLGDASYEALNCVTWIDGSKIGPTFTGPGGAPAIGGIPIRDRRAAVNVKESFKLQYPIGNWFIRPVGCWYMNDYKTDHSSAPGYLNYADRDDMNGGVDVGYKVFEKTYVVAGYRYGHQDQDAFLGNPQEYSNDYQRPVFGAEGSPLPWLKFSLLAGPELHRFGPNVAAGFDRNQDQLFADFAATLTLGKTDAVTLSAKRYTRPAYTGRNELQEFLCEATWGHKFTEALSGNVGFTSYLADYAPMARNDEIYTPTVAVTYQFSKHFSAELRYSYDAAVSEVPDTDGREFQRQIAEFSLRYTF